MVVSAKAIYESGSLRLLEKLDLQEGQEVHITIERLDEDGYPVQETLADVLGFDPDDEEKARALAESQYQAIKKITGIATTDEPDDASERHDEYLYGEATR
jgi:predicted DNA-binding antitoxin AbrB/MazE fold protein